MKNKKDIHEYKNYDRNTSDLVNIFVYGTLKVGGYYAGYFDQVRLCSVPCTIKGALYRITGGWFPGLILDETRTVHGELHVYKNAKKVIALMDTIEGVSSGLFRKETVNVKIEDNKNKEAIVYVFNHIITENNAVIIETGTWPIDEKEKLL